MESQFLQLSFDITWKITKENNDFLYTHVNKRTYNLPFLPRRAFYFFYFSGLEKMLRTLRVLWKCQKNQRRDTEKIQRNLSKTRG